MTVKREGERITITTGKSSTTFAPIKSEMNMIDDNTFKCWLDECAKQLRPNARPITELVAFLTEHFDLDPLTMEDIQMQFFWRNFLQNHFGAHLKHHSSPLPTEDMTDEELENWQLEKEAQREEVRLISPDNLDYKVHGFKILHTEKNKSLIDADCNQWWGRCGEDHGKAYEVSTESDSYFFYEETTRSGNGTGFGCDALFREMSLFLGITAEDIRNRTPRFLDYASDLAEDGRLTSLSDYKRQKHI